MNTKVVAQFKHTGASGAESPVPKKERSGIALPGHVTTAPKEKFETTAAGPR
jgi:hypothetical protein